MQFILAAALLAGMAGCQLQQEAAFEKLAAEPLPVEPWMYANHAGEMIKTPHFHIYTTIDDPVYQHLLARVLEATHERVTRLNLAATGTAAAHTAPLECYVFASRSQWEGYTRDRGGTEATVYLQISSGGYSAKGIFAGYDIGRNQTLSVIAHEAWHQYAYFAFKDHIPAWLDEGLATQNEAIEWHGTDPVFMPELNWRRMAALRQAVRANTLWKLPELLSTHAGRVIKMPQASIDAYYAELWSFTLFLEQSPVYGPRLQALLADAAAGKLAQNLKGTGVTQAEIDGFTENWNTVAGPLYLKKYVRADLGALEQEYQAWMREFIHSGRVAANRI